MQKLLSLLLDVEREGAGETTHGLGDGREDWCDLRRELAQNWEALR